MNPIQTFHSAVSGIENGHDSWKECVVPAHSLALSHSPSIHTLSLSSMHGGPLAPLSSLGSLTRLHLRKPLENAHRDLANGTILRCSIPTLQTMHVDGNLNDATIILDIFTGLLALRLLLIQVDEQSGGGRWPASCTVSSVFSSMRRHPQSWILHGITSTSRDS